MKDTKGQVPLIRAGINGWNTNTLIPTSGNRLHFAQHHDPYIRSLGMFLSWAQAKTAQMNSLVKRVEDGDVALAIKMIGALTIYGGIREMQIITSPSVKYYEDNKPSMLSGRWFQEAATVGGIIPWPVEKMTRFLGGGAISTPIENITPLFAYMNRLLGTPRAFSADLGVGDYEGATVEALKPLPFGRDITNIINRIMQLRGGSFEDLPNDEFARKTATSGSTGLTFFEGGKVNMKDYPVSNVIEDPSERIDSRTRLPFDNPMERLGFKGGGLLDGVEEPLHRLGFKGGGLLLHVGVAPISEKQVKSLKKILKKRKSKRDGGYVREKMFFGGTAGRVLRRALEKRYKEKRKEPIKEIEVTAKKRPSLAEDLREAGFSRKEVQAALLGNIAVESPKYDHTSKGSNQAHGLFGLDPSPKGKKAAYDAYLKDKKIEDSNRSQIQFVHDTIYGDRQDLIGRETARRLREVFEKGNVDEITTAFSNMWERPGTPHMDRRLEKANEWYGSMNPSEAPIQ